MGVKNTSIGQLLTVGALGLVAHQIYRHYRTRGETKQDRIDRQDFEKKDHKLDQMLKETFPASDPLPLSGSSIGHLN